MKRDQDTVDIHRLRANKLLSIISPVNAKKNLMDIMQSVIIIHSILTNTFFI